MERGFLSQTGPDGEVLHPIEEAIFIGSSATCEVVVKNAAPRQCQISKTADGYIAYDLTGQKLTRVDGTRIDRHVLFVGEMLTVGSAEFVWKLIEVPDPVASPERTRPTRRRERPATERIPVHPNRRRQFVLGGIAAAALVGIGVLAMMATSAPTSNTDRPAVTRDAPRGRSEILAPAPVEPRAAIVNPPSPPEPRQDTGGFFPRDPADAPPLRVTEAPADRKDALPAVVPPDSLPGVPLPAPRPGRPHEILAFYNQPDRIDPAAEAAARASPRFEVRYAALLLGVHRALARGTGHEAAYRNLMEASAPAGAVDHLRALAASLKEAVACRECTTGRVACDRCQGKGRVDLDCQTCGGQGRIRASGAVGNAEVSVKCRNCEGRKVFRGVGCPSCSRSGRVACAGCKGKPWPDDRCPQSECRDGRVSCPQCHGKGWEAVKCPHCTGGRAPAPGAALGADVTMKCRNCEVNGQQGNGTIKTDCKVCSRTGKVTCGECGGAFASRPDRGAGRTAATAVFTTEPCGSCRGGTDCSRCLGLGVRIRPVSDPNKVIP